MESTRHISDGAVGPDNDRAEADGDHQDESGDDEGKGRLDAHPGAAFLSAVADILPTPRRMYAPNGYFPRAIGYAS
jgi:hypothetical protein